MKNYSSSPETIAIYVEDKPNQHFNDLFSSNFESISRQFYENGIQLIYLPLVLQDRNYLDIVEYNRPFLHAAIEERSLQEIYSGLKNRLRNRFPGEGLIIKTLHNYGFYTGYPLKPGKELQGQLVDIFSLAKQLEEKSLNNTPLFRLKDDAKIKLETSVANEIQFEYETVVPYEKPPLSDQNFSTEAFRLAREIRTKILQLKESGSLRLLDNILEEVLDVKSNLSVLYITNDYRIFLKDYEMKEVVMAPLPKALFLLFLRHPEGILFKELRDYRDELLSIYKNVTTHEDLTRAIESINAMTDPLNNSVNEKCSRIRAAFLQVVADEIAENYYITGLKGEPKQIRIDRTKVIFQ